MNLYKIHCPEGTRFAGSMADARKARQELVDTLDVKKASVEIDEFELSTKKPDLLATLNEIAALADGVTTSGDEE
jgi:hypothetical protein